MVNPKSIQFFGLTILFFVIIPFRYKFFSANNLLYLFRIHDCPLTIHHCPPKNSYRLHWARNCPGSVHPVNAGKPPFVPGDEWFG